MKAEPKQAKETKTQASTIEEAPKVKPRKTFIERYRAARMAGTPIIAIQTIDTRRTIDALVNNSKETTPFVAWNCVEGWRGVNTPGKEAMAAALAMADNADPSMTRDPIDHFSFAKNLRGKVAENDPPGSVLFVENAHRYLDSAQGTNGADYAQAVFNLRDIFKASQRTVVLLGAQFTFPAELAQHVCVIDEPLPDAATIADIITRLLAAQGMELSDTDAEQAVNALRGVGHFGAEQAAAMALTRDGLDLQDLWGRKRQMVAATPGLSIWDSGEMFSDIGGCYQIKDFMSRILTGKRKPKVIVFIDEIEKAFAGATSGTSDSSGVSQGFLGTILQEMNDKKYTGPIFVGPPGAAKSAIAKAIGNQAEIPTVVFSLSEMKDSLMGSSEARLRQALKIVDAVGDGNALWVATCNKIAGLPPELKRRFKMGVWFFDLPTPEERKQIWGIYTAKFELTPEQCAALPDDTDWTGAEIENCCDVADRTGLTLLESAQYIVPVARSNRETIIQLRHEAAGRYNSAAYPGPYKIVEDPKPLETGEPIDLSARMRGEV